MTRPGWEERQVRNDASLGTAEHHAQPWLGYELDILMDWDRSEEELRDLAELLGRTIEACRQHYYVTRRLDAAQQRRARRTARARGGPSPVAREVAGQSSPGLAPRTVSHASWSAEDQAEYPADWYC